jgi:hypothetical protein
MTLSSIFSVHLGQSQTVTFAGDGNQGNSGRWMQSKVEQFSKETGIPVQYVARPNSTTETLMLWQQDWSARTADIDIYLIDVIWPAIAAPHAADLMQYYTPEELKEFFPRIDKDGEAGHLPAGRGRLDYPYYIELLQRSRFEGAIILHALKPAEAKDRLAFVRSVTPAGYL